jgi:predicted flavoprotein YhiN
VRLDLRPNLSREALAARLAAPRRGQSTSNFLRKTAGLSPVAINLLRECPSQGQDLPAAIKALDLRLTGTTGLARAISTAGGLRLDAVLPPGVFAAGEMLDWEAPTGGYLLQAAFSTGYAAGEAALAWLSAA